MNYPGSRRDRLKEALLAGLATAPKTVVDPPLAQAVALAFHFLACAGQTVELTGILQPQGGRKPYRPDSTRWPQRVCNVINRIPHRYKLLNGRRGGFPGSSAPAYLQRMSSAKNTIRPLLRSCSRTGRSEGGPPAGRPRPTVASQAFGCLVRATARTACHTAVHRDLRTLLFLHCLPARNCANNLFLRGNE